MTAQPNSAEEICFEVQGLNLAGKRWNRGAKHRAIALHGWLDNCGSFDPTAELLEDIDLVAIDSAGQGKSDFRSADSQYLIWYEVSDLFAIADQLNWDCFNLIGHSRGAGIATISAGTFPHRIDKLLLIEGVTPFPMEAEDVPDNLAAHILQSQALQNRQSSVFSSRQQAISARCKGFTKVSVNAAEILARRSLLQDDKGFYWHADARLKAPSSLKLTDAQIDAFLARISAAVLLIEADQGILPSMPFAEHCLAIIAKLTRIELEGGHHLHMEDAAASCAQQISNFIKG